MATYLTLIKFTERGIKDIKDTLQASSRLQIARQETRHRGQGTVLVHAGSRWTHHFRRPGRRNNNRSNAFVEFTRECYHADASILYR